MVSSAIVSSAILSVAAPPPLRQVGRTRSRAARDAASRSERSRTAAPPPPPPPAPKGQRLRATRRAPRPPPPAAPYPRPGGAPHRRRPARRRCCPPRAAARPARTWMDRVTGWTPRVPGCRLSEHAPGLDAALELRHCLARVDCAARQRSCAADSQSICAAALHVHARVRFESECQLSHLARAAAGLPSAQPPQP